MRKLALLVVIPLLTGCLGFLPKKDGQFWWPTAGMPESELIDVWGSGADNTSVSTGGEPITIRRYEVTAFGNVFGGTYLYRTDNLFVPCFYEIVVKDGEISAVIEECGRGKVDRRR
jgi:hypothetical protein